MTEKLIFGKAETFAQALLRLPQPDNPWLQEDEELRALVCVRHCFAPNAEGSMVPLTESEIKLMAGISFRRGDLLTERRWQNLPQESDWYDLFTPERENDDAYRHWKISKLEPNHHNPDISLICVEINANFADPHPKDSEFWVGALSQQDLDDLLKNLIQD